MFGPPSVPVQVFKKILYPDFTKGNSNKLKKTAAKANQRF
jgi:hypothetical protein